jgi:hypothetical protein
MASRHRRPKMIAERHGLFSLFVILAAGWSAATTIIHSGSTRPSCAGRVSYLRRQRVAKSVLGLLPERAENVASALRQTLR